jgi:hypothetical protein
MLHGHWCVGLSLTSHNNGLAIGAFVWPFRELIITVLRRLLDSCYSGDAHLVVSGAPAGIHYEASCLNSMIELQQIR